MKLNVNTVMSTLAVVIGVVILMLQYCNPKPNPNVYPKDTVRIEKPFVIRDTIWKDAKPQKPVYVEKWNDSLIYRDTGSVVKDTIFLDRDKRLARLIKGEFDQDYIKLTTADSSNRVFTDTYLTDYQTKVYDYDGITRTLTSRPRPTGGFSDDFGFDGGNSLNGLRNLKGFESNAYLLYGSRGNIMGRFDASVNFKRWGLYGYGQASTMLPNLEAGAGIRYRIK